MAAQTVHFMNGTSKSLASSLLTALFKGQSKFSILPFAATKQASGTQAGGIKWAELSFQGADELFTVKDSFTIDKADNTEEKFQIDQNNGQTIDSQITEFGELTFSGNFPAVAAEVFAVWHKEGVDITTLTGQDGTSYAGQGFFLNSKQIDCVCLIENANVDRAIAFARVAITIDEPTVADGKMVCPVKGTILANPEASGLEGDFAILAKSGS